jgi:hypothetical protein
MSLSSMSVDCLAQLCSLILGDRFGTPSPPKMPPGIGGRHRMASESTEPLVRCLGPTKPRIPFAFKKDITFANLFQQLRGACSLSSRRNAWNLSRSRRSMSSRFSLWQDSTKYASAVLWPPASLASSRNGPVAVLAVRHDGRAIVPVGLSANGRVKPDLVIVNGKQERHAEGAYYLEWRENGRRVGLSVGKCSPAAFVPVLITLTCRVYEHSFTPAPRPS